MAQTLVVPKSSPTITLSFFFTTPAPPSENSNFQKPNSRNGKISSLLIVVFPY
jgi:hypothetical protein